MPANTIHSTTLTGAQQAKPYLEPYKVILGYQVCFYALIKGLYVVHDHNRNSYYAFYHDGHDGVDNAMEHNIRVHMME